MKHTNLIYYSERKKYVEHTGNFGLFQFSVYFLYWIAVSTAVICVMTAVQTTVV